MAALQPAVQDRREPHNILDTVKEAKNTCPHSATVELQRLLKNVGTFQIRCPAIGNSSRKIIVKSMSFWSIRQLHSGRNSFLKQPRGLAMTKLFFFGCI